MYIAGRWIESVKQYANHVFHFAQMFIRIFSEFSTFLLSVSFQSTVSDVKFGEETFRKMMKKIQDQLSFFTDYRHLPGVSML